MPHIRTHESCHIFEHIAHRGERSTHTSHATHSKRKIVPRAPLGVPRCQIVPKSLRRTCSAVCRVVERVAGCCRVLQCVAWCCSVLQSKRTLSHSHGDSRVFGCVVGCCSVLQCVAVCCSVLQCSGAVCRTIRRVAGRCSVLRCTAACCSVLQCVAACCSGLIACIIRVEKLAHLLQGIVVGLLQRVALLEIEMLARIFIWQKFSTVSSLLYIYSYMCISIYEKNICV